MSEHIEIETLGAVRVIRLNRPQAMNAITGAMFDALRAGFDAAGQDPLVRSVLFCSTGRAFSVGADLNDPLLGFDLPMEERADACRATLGDRLNPLVMAIAECRRPVVTAINGICAGGGVGLALSGDMVVAGQSARIMLGFVPVLGLTPDLGATWHLVKKLGRARAHGLMLTGKPISAAQAVEWGLIWDTLPDDALETHALELAQTLAAGPSDAQMTLRGLVDAAVGNDLSAQLAAECEAQASRSTSPEVAEAVSAFLTKRKPDFSMIPPKD